MAVFYLKINKKQYQADVDPSTPLLWVATIRYKGHGWNTTWPSADIANPG